MNVRLNQLSIQIRDGVVKRNNNENKFNKQKTNNMAYDNNDHYVVYSLSNIFTLER